MLKHIERRKQQRDMVLIRTIINHLTGNWYCNVRYVTMTQAVCVPMGINSAAFSAIFFLHSYEEEYMSSIASTDKIKARYLH